MNRITMNGYTRISKAEALRRFTAGEEILICPCKCRPKNMQGVYYCASLEREQEIYLYYDKLTKEGREATPTFLFTRVVNNYTYWNCNHEAWGRYPAFYRKEE